MTHAPEPPLIRFADGDQRNPFRLLVDLHHHNIEGPAVRSRSDILAELALSAAAVSWWSHWQPMSIHAALRSGADPADIATVTGLKPAEVCRRRQRCTDVRTRLVNDCRMAVDVDDVRMLRRQLRAEEVL